MQADISQNEKISLKIYIKIKKNNFNTKYVNFAGFSYSFERFWLGKRRKVNNDSSTVLFLYMRSLHVNNSWDKTVVFLFSPPLFSRLQG
jgi:hypothetical protein